MSRLFEELREGEEYMMFSVSLELGKKIKELNEEEWYFHSIKQKNVKHTTDEVLQGYYKERKKIQKSIDIREQDLNHE
jgi:hypothetical protein